MDQRERQDDPEETFRTAFEGMQAKLWTATPGFVAAVDLEKQTVSVQPTIRGRVTDKEGVVSSVNLPLLVDVPLIFPRAGGFALTFPVAIGDEVLAVFASRAIDSWWQSGGIGEQVETRMHDLSDAFAIMGPTSQPKKLTAVSTTNVQLRNEVGDNYIELTPGGDVNVVAPGLVSLTAGGNVVVMATGNATINAAIVDVTASSEISLTAPTINLNGAVGASAGITATGDITTSADIHADGDVTAGATSLETHEHGGVVPGGGTSGPPV